MENLRDTPKINDDYILAIGKDDERRLELQHRLNSENSYEHLAKAGLGKGKVVWDIGCGSGTITEYLAMRVGIEGHVYAMDISKEQLEVAKARIEALSLENVTFFLGDITQINDLPQKEADIVYSRYLLMHLRSPIEALKNMKALLKPEGVIALQEPIWGKSHSSINSEVFKVCANSGIILTQSKGLDYNIGIRLKEFLENLSFPQVEENYIEQKLSAKDTKLLLSLGIKEWMPKALEAGITAKEDIELLHEAVDNLSDEDQLFYYSTTQAFVLGWEN